ncbi:MAG: S8 family serine peptidase [Acidobacteriota bacterium]
MNTQRLKALAASAIVLFSLLALSATALAEPDETRSKPRPAAKLLIHQSERIEAAELERELSSFIVALAAERSQVDRLVDELSADYRGEIVVQKIWRRAFVGLVIETDLATAQRLAEDGRVRYVEQNVLIETRRETSTRGQSSRFLAEAPPVAPVPYCYDESEKPFVLDPYPESSPTIAWNPLCPFAIGCTGNWGLDRIDDRQPGLDGTYQPVIGSHPVDVFIIDSTVGLGHLDLNRTPSDQVFLQGASTVADPHGTHVAGIIAGKNFGVSHAGVRFHAVSFGGRARIPVDLIVDGFETVLNNRNPGIPAVVSLSANSGSLQTSVSLLEAVRQVIADDVVVVNSAGNIGGSLTCADANRPDQLADGVTLSGGSFPSEILIVGATDDQDGVYCECGNPTTASTDCGSRQASPGRIDLYAPGAEIVSMAIASPNAICRLSGTSMAAPHVAGAAALLLSRFPEASPQAIAQGLVDMSTRGAVSDFQGLPVANNGLLYVGPYSSSRPVAGNKWFFARPGTTLSIPKADLVGSSFDWQGRTLQVSSLSQALNGQLVDRGTSVDFTIDPGALPIPDAERDAGFTFGVHNGLQTASGRVNVVVTLNEAPRAQFSYSGSGLDYTFDATGSSDDVGIVSYRWEFPGGIVKYGPVVDHFFTEFSANPILGDPVNLVVTDTDGVTGFSLRAVRVNPPPGVQRPASGMWFNPDRSGNGFTIYANSANQLTLTWYTYEADGTPIWYLSDTIAQTENSAWSADLMKVRRIGGSVSLETVGTVRLNLSDPELAWFSWTLDGVSGGERFELLLGGGSRGGLWFPPGDSGWGLTVTEGYSNGVLTMVNTLTYYSGSEPRWVQGTVASSSNTYVPMKWHSGPGLCPSCSGSAPPTLSNAGSIRVEIPATQVRSGFLTTFVSSPQGGSWFRPRQQILALTLP